MFLFEYCYDFCCAFFWFKVDLGFLQTGPIKYYVFGGLKLGFEAVALSPATRFFTPRKQDLCEMNSMEAKLKVDGKEIPLNEFTEKILQGIIVGAVGSLRGIKEDWKKLEVEI